MQDTEGGSRRNGEVRRAEDAAPLTPEGTRRFCKQFSLFTVVQIAGPLNNGTTLIVVKYLAVSCGA